MPQMGHFGHTEQTGHTMSNADKTVFFAGIDAGGTSFKCALADVNGGLLAKKRFVTTDPETVIADCSHFLRTEAAARNGRIASLGIAAFGPLDVDPTSETYGTILNTPKPGWSNTKLKAHFEDALKVPVNIDTDVNGALLAELYDGAAKGAASAAYVTIGTGIGAGVYAGGNLIGKPQHPEFGHIRVARHKDDRFEGACRFHGDCLEGLASAVAFTARFGAPQELPAEHEGWEMQANYLAQACWTISLSFRPERILLGGGLMLAPHLIELVRDAYFNLSNGYLGEDRGQIATMITRPAHGDDAGLRGGLYLARQASS